MKKTLIFMLILAAALSLCAVSLAATVVDSGECDSSGNVTWTLDDEGLLVIQGNGLITWDPWDNKYETDIKQIEIRSGVTGIDCMFAFGDCVNLTKVSLPDTLVKIDEYAFDACSSLTGITLPKNLETLGSAAFRNCTSLAAISLPEKITEIEDYLFENCSQLKTVSVSKGLTKIGYSAFRKCSALTGFTFPEGLKSIASYAFSGCESLKTVSLPDSLDKLESYAFGACSGMTDLRFPKSLQTLPYALCSGCSSLKNITLPENVYSVGIYCFSGCSSLETIRLPRSVRKIHDSAFQNCDSLKDVYYDGTKEDRAGISITTTDNEALLNATWHYREEGTPPADPSDPDSPPDSNPPVSGNTATVSGVKYKLSGSKAVVTGPKDKNAKKLTIKDTVKINGKSYKVTEIRANAFKGMKKLTAVTIGSNVKTIGKSAFQSCAKLKTITIKSKKLTKSSVKTNAFKGIYKKATFKCPKGLKDAYKKILTKKGAPKTCKFK